MMALAGLFRHDAIEWMTCMTYQSASGAGAQNMRELLVQMGEAHMAARGLLEDPSSAILDIDREVAGILRDPNFPKEHFGVPLAGSLIPWIDRDMGDGMSREEWKGGVETNKILGRDHGSGKRAIPVDSICVRIGAMRCHSQALTIKLTRDIPLAEIEAMLAAGNEWVRVIPNTSRRQHPAADAGRRDRIAGSADRPAAQARDGQRVPRRVHRRRPVAVGRRRTLAAHDTDSARALTGLFLPPFNRSAAPMCCLMTFPGFATKRCRHATPSPAAGNEMQQRRRVRAGLRSVARMRYKI